MSLTDAEIREKVNTVRRWYHRFHLRPGIVTPGVTDPAVTLRLLDIPADCRGLRALDLGARDGYFSFELERRGANVLAVDYAHPDDTGFRVAAEVLGSKVEYRQANIYDLSSDKAGTFDIVLFLGLLYHLPDPFQAVAIVRCLCRPDAFLGVETHVIDNGLLLADGTKVPLGEVDQRLTDVPLARFYRGRTLHNDATNYWGLNLRCVEDMLGECRFTVLSRTLRVHRAVLNCRAVEDAELSRLNAMARGLGSKSL